MKRKYSPIHDKWHVIVEGQIRDCIHHHPKWFNFENDRQKRDCINSLAKRIVGEIAADGNLAAKVVGSNVDGEQEEVDVTLNSSEEKH